MFYFILGICSTNFPLHVYLILSFAIHSPGICMKKKSSLATGLFYPVFYLSGWHWQVFLSLVLFDVHYQRREIGIRRVYGSSVSEILYRLNKVYLKVLLISFVIAIPVSYYFMERWGSNFMEKVPVSYLIYFVALLGISILTVGVVTFQSWRAANENPVDML